MKLLSGVIVFAAVAGMSAAQANNGVSPAEAELAVLQVRPALAVKNGKVRVVAERVTAAEKRHPEFYYYQVRRGDEKLIGNFAVSKQTATLYDQDFQRVVKSKAVRAVQEVIRRNGKISAEDIKQDEAKWIAPL